MTIDAGRRSVFIKTFVLLAAAAVLAVVLSLGGGGRPASGAPALEIALVGSNFDLSTGFTTQRLSPSVAYNSVNNEYMAVWFDLRNPGNNDVFGQRVSAAGGLVGVNFPIIEFADSQHDPVVAYNSIDNEYLVVWQTQQAGFFNQTRGRRISSTGTHLGPDFLVTDAGHENSIAYNRLANEFLVTGRGAGIKGQRVSRTGALVGAGISIGTVAGAPAPNGQVAFDPNTNQYFATWRDQMNNNLKGRRVAADGSLVGSPVIISPLFPGSEMAASVAHDSTRDRFLVVFGVAGETRIVGQLVSGNGQLIGSNFDIATGLASSASPYAAYSPMDDVFVLAWSAGSDIVAQLLANDGTPMAQSVVVAQGSAVGQHPALAYNSQTGEFLVVWSDNRNIPQGEEDIFAQVIDIRQPPAPPPPGPPPPPSPGALSLFPGCNVAAFMPSYVPGEDLGAIAAEIAGGNPRFWFQTGPTGFAAFDPRFPQGSDVTNLDAEAGFVCVEEATNWARPSGPSPPPLSPVRDLFAGCNVVAFTPYYPLGTDLTVPAGGIADGNPRFWFQTGPTGFAAFDPRFPQGSDITTLAHEAGFICMDTDTTWNRAP